MFKQIILRLLIICAPFTVNAKILETSHIADVIPLIDADTWFLVDLDHTMFEGAEAYGHAHWFYDVLDEGLKNGLSKEEVIVHFYPRWVKTQQTCPVKPLKEEFIVFLKDLQKQEIVVMGFTHRQPLVAEATLRQVASLDFDYALTAPSQEIFSLETRNPTLYKNGILFVGDFNKKGEIFLPFLNYIHKQPKKVVFIDDKRKNVEEVESVLEQLGIEYIGIHYTAIEHAAPIYSRELADEQFQRLEQQEFATQILDHISDEMYWDCLSD